MIRGGGGLFYSNNWGVGTGSATFGSAGYIASTTIVTSLDGVNPIVESEQSVSQRTRAAHGIEARPGHAARPGDRFLRSRQSARHTAPNGTSRSSANSPASTLLEVGYTGSRGLKFPIGVQLNQLPDADLALRATRCARW